MTSSYKRAPSASEVTLVLGSASVALMRGLAPAALGQASTVKSEGPPLLGDCGQDFELQQFWGLFFSGSAVQLRKPQSRPFLGPCVHSHSKRRAGQDDLRDPGLPLDPAAIGWASAPLRETPCPPPTSPALRLCPSKCHPQTSEGAGHASE